jgi:polar amino acid transport system substrate-binding protein
MSSNSLLFRRVRTLMFALTALPLVSHAAVETIAPGKLTYGTAATFMPFEFVKEGKLTGFDIDLINALSKEIQLTPAPMPMEFKGLIPALQGNVSISSTPPCTSTRPVPRRSTSCPI